jgi:hypothetical protein
LFVEGVARVALGSLVAIVAACGSSVDYPPSRIPASVRVTGRVLDGNKGTPLPHVPIAIEIGGHYVTNPDTSKGNPSYQRGTITDDQGAYTITLPSGSLGFHSFLDGYRYGTEGLMAQADATFDLMMEKRDLESPPTLTNARLEPSQVSAGASFVVKVTAAAATPTDPLSEEVIVVEATTTMSAALDPPSPGVQGKGFPDGQWSRTLVAPTHVGTYSYVLSATTEGCIVSDLAALQLEVK